MKRYNPAFHGIFGKMLEKNGKMVYNIISYQCMIESIGNRLMIRIRRKRHKKSGENT